MGYLFNQSLCCLRIQSQLQTQRPEWRIETHKTPQSLTIGYKYALEIHRDLYLFASSSLSREVENYNTDELPHTPTPTIAFFLLSYCKITSQGPS